MEGKHKVFGPHSVTGRDDPNERSIFPLDLLYNLLPVDPVDPVVVVMILSLDSFQLLPLPLPLTAIRSK